MASLTQCLPADRFIKSTIRIDDRSPAAFSFGCIMIMTDEALGGPGGTASPIDATDRVNTYVTIDDVAAEWDTTSAAYQAALAAFSQNPGPDLIKIGFVNGWTQAEVIALNECDSTCYGYVAATLRDNAAVLDLAAWFETQTKVFVTTSNDILTQDQTNTSNIAEQLKQAGYDRTMVMYHDDAQYYPSAAFLAVALANDFDQFNTAYTGKFKTLSGIPAVGLTGTTLQAVTGYVPQTGLDANQGHYANTIACICGTDIVVEGNMSSGRFFDSIHATDWIKIRIEEALCSAMLRSHIPYTQAGLSIVADQIQDVLVQAQAAGIVATPEAVEGEYVAGYEIQVPRISTATDAQRSNRVAPCVQYQARLTSAFHSVCTDGTATVFANPT